MSRRVTRMPLYEVMRPGSRRTPGAAAPIPGDGDVRFGGVIRLPMGVLLLAVAGVLFGLIIAYSAGYSRADAAADRRIEQLLLEQRADLGDQVYAATGQPVSAGRGGDGGGEHALDRGGNAVRSGAAPADIRRTSGDRPGLAAGDRPDLARGGTGPGNTPSGDVAGGSDDPELAGAAWRRPRVQWWDEYFLDPINTTPGPWYWLLMTTNREGATRFIDFARARGLETYAVPVNNARSDSYRVYVVPGLHTNSTDHEWHAPMRAFIDRLGEEWAREPGSGGKSLDDAYLHFFG